MGENGAREAAVHVVRSLLLTINFSYVCLPELFLRFVAQRPLTVPTPFSGINQKLPISSYTLGQKSLYDMVSVLSK